MPGRGLLSLLHNGTCEAKNTNLNYNACLQCLHVIETSNRFLLLTLSKLWNMVQGVRLRMSMMRLPRLMAMPTEANPTMTYLDETEKVMKGWRERGEMRKLWDNDIQSGLEAPQDLHLDCFAKLFYEFPTCIIQSPSQVRGWRTSANWLISLVCNDKLSGYQKGFIRTLQQKMIQCRIKYWWFASCIGCARMQARRKSGWLNSGRDIRKCILPFLTQVSDIVVYR